MSRRLRRLRWRHKICDRSEDDGECYSDAPSSHEESRSALSSDEDLIREAIEENKFIVGGGGVSN